MMTRCARIRPAASLKAALLGASILGLSAFATVAQDTGNPFAPRLVINEHVISNYEVEQRALFLQLLRVPGDPEKEALKGLTEDRLGAQAARALSIKLTPEQVSVGMEEFAKRANLTTDEFVKALSDGGVEPQTFRDFVAAGLLWREVIRAKFGGSVRISETQIDRALAETARKPDVKLLLSELILPVRDGDVDAALEEARSIKAQVNSENAFATAARQYSAAPTANRGGRLDWMPISNLPPAIVSQVVTLGPGDVSDPIVVPDAVVLFYLNNLSEGESAMPSDVQVDYARFALPAGMDVATVQAQTDRCGDLYPLARGLPETSLVQTTSSMSDVPQNIGLDLAKMDPGESIAQVQPDGTTVLLMLCSRTGTLPDAAPATPDAQTGTDAASETPAPAGPDREAVRTQLGNQQLALLAAGFMEELRSEAIIKEP
jgi:peptidyl-prolyl cis-trans isomerase SurA